MRRRDERGVVLVVVLWLLVAATALTLALGRETKVEVGLSVARADEVLLRAAADSLLERAKAELRLDETPYDTLFDPWRDDEARFAGAPVRADGSVGEGLAASDAAVVARAWLVLPEPDPGDGRELRFGIRDEASRLDVNLATREQLAALPGITDEAIDAILDWRDEDDDPEPLGAEAEVYAAKEPPYLPKNGFFESLHELLRVEGVDAAMLYGEDRNRNGLLDPGEDDGDRSFPPDDADGLLDRGLIDYLTVVARDLDRTADGRERLLWSQASPDQIEQRLREAGVSDATAARLRTLKGMASDAQSLGEILGPLFAFGGPPDPSEVDAIVDEITAFAGQAVPGRINVNTAATEVLAGLFEPEEVDAIVTARLDPSRDLSSPAWLLEVVDPGRFAEVVDRVTVRSWQFTVQGVVLLEGRPRLRRFEALLDRAYAPVRVLTWSDTTALGFPLPDERGEELP